MKFHIYLLCILLLSMNGLAQQTVSGKVITDDDPSGLPGVTVKVKSNSNGAVTDIDGRYTISANSTDTLIFSYVGFVSQELVVGNRTTINVSLDPDIEALSEVVVIGYGTVTRRELSNSVVSLGEEVIENKPFVTVEQALQGNAAGVQVIQPSGAPGSGISVRIRGANSISASNDPLYIVDGIQVLNTEGINPNDVASISVLKDAAAVAIYGARGSNGVVIINTKRGEGAEPTLSFSTYYGVESVTRTLGVLNSEQFIDYLNEARDNSGLAPLSEPNNFQYNTDWQKELYDPAVIQNYQISFSGGTKKGNFFASAGYQGQEGTISPSGFERYSLRFNQDMTISDRISFGSSIALSRTNFDFVNDNQRVNSGGVVLSALTTPPTIPPQLEDGTFPLNPYQAWENPIALVRAEKRNSFTNKILGNLYMEYKLPLDITFKSSFSLDAYNSKFDFFVDPFSTGFGRAQQGEASNSTFNELVWIWEQTLNYNKDLGGEHNLDALLGYSNQRSRFESTFLRGIGFANGSVPTAAGASEPLDINAQVAEWAFESFFGRLSYNYKGKYLLAATMRVDGSSRFGPGNRYGYFPSVSVGWNMTDEAFLDNSSWLYVLKLRGSYGLTGNSNIGNYDWYATYGLGSDYPFGNAPRPGVFRNQIGNPDLKWEPTTQIDIGFDAEFFEGRINLTADLYQRTTNDMLLDVQLPTTSGFFSARQNVGSLENKGVDIGLGGSPIRTSDFSWRIDGNFSLNRSKVLDTGGEPLFGGGVPDQGNVTLVEEGQPLGNFYGWVMEGINPENGNVIFRDNDDNGVIDGDDREIIGNALPDFIWGVTNTINFKGFELIVFFQGVQGQDIYNATRFELESMSTFKNQSRAVLDRWTPDNTDGSLPIAAFGDPADNDRISTRWIEDGSFIKLRELTIAYNLPQTALDKIGVSKMRVYVQGRNFWTLTDYSGYDPEVSRDGGNPLSLNIDYGTYPQVQTFMAGLNINF